MAQVDLFGSEVVLTPNKINRPPIFQSDTIEDAAVRYFRETGFPYRKLPLFICFQELNRLASLEGDQLLNTNIGYAVADTYHPHRFRGHATKMKSPVEAFSNEKLLRKTIKQYLEYNGAVSTDITGKLAIVSGTQANSNFRPGFACYIYREYCRPGDTVLDTSTGYGGRLIGFIASQTPTRYIGIDPSRETHDGNVRMVDDLQRSDSVTLLNYPVEDLDVTPFRNRCDFAFTSPPYFTKEYYADEETQSHNRYPTYSQWRDRFLAAMIKYQWVALRAGATNIINIQDVNIGSKRYPLVEDTIHIAKDIGFDFIRMMSFQMSNRFGCKMDGRASEPCIILRKPKP